MSREADLYKDKIEVSLDGRQIFYLFFGGAVIVGLVFVLGVMVGRRVEARGHVDRARTTAAVDPLAALDRLENNGGLSFKGSLMSKDGAAAPSDVEREIGEREKARKGKDGKPAASKQGDGNDADSAGKAEHKAKGDAGKVTEAKTIAKTAEDKASPKVEPKAVAKESGTKTSDDKSKGDSNSSSSSKAASDDGKAKLDGGGGSSKVEKTSKVEDRDKPKSDDAKGDKPVTKIDDVKPKSEDPPKTRYTLQLSSFQDRAEADAFLAALKAQGHQAHVVEASVSGKGTFYRVRMGSFKSIEAANDAKAEFEKAAKKSASVMKL